MGFVVKGFIDSGAKPGQMVDGVPCFPIDGIDEAAATAAVLVIGINNFRTPVDEVVRWAERIGFAEIVTVPELPDLLGPDLGNYWQAPRGLLTENSDAIEQVAALLSDDRSRAIFEQLLRYRVTGRPEDHPEVDRDRQYFPVDLPMAQSTITAVDCGAFPGDLVETAQKAGTPISRWFAFEPDPANFRALSDFAAGFPSLGEAALFPCGVGAQTGSVGFTTGNADASRASAANEGTELLPILRIDDVLWASGIDLVKLDIEGFEAAALDGMAGLLARHRPRLAMAIYHKPADLWKLPLKVNAMLPGGRFAIRQHGYNGYDTVLYVDWT
ncbi:FkbM family methyltransferase [Sphingomonas sp. ABOLD]|uniref:FkbM family methyltransferase n=1 Tax=Sphingomonas sp. ABOLD TaxID=1985877 RepID=UPI0013DEBE44|nr:FkbM family methyltransferase [Sphingomonas sp. ABOLD]